MELIYIGEHFYFESGTSMSSIYTKDGQCSDWGYVGETLRKGEPVSIRPATQQELDFYEAKLSRLKQTNG